MAAPPRPQWDRPTWRGNALLAFCSPVFQKWEPSGFSAFRHRCMFQDFRARVSRLRIPAPLRSPRPSGLRAPPVSIPLRSPRPFGLYIPPVSAPLRSLYPFGLHTPSVSVPLRSPHPFGLRAPSVSVPLRSLRPFRLRRGNAIRALRLCSRIAPLCSLQCSARDSLLTTSSGQAAP